VVLVVFACFCQTIVLGGNGISVNVQQQCVTVPLIDKDLCATFTLDSCSLSVFAELSYDGQDFFKTNITNLSDQENCRTVVGADSGSGGHCESCLGFDELTIQPGYVEMCSRITITCWVAGIKLPADVVRPKPCVEFGEDCEYQTCDTCTRGGKCGWCGSTNQCYAKGSSGPYCSSCLTEDWVTGICDTGQLHVKQEGSKGVLVVVAVCSVSVVVIGLVVFFLWRRHGRKTPHTYVRQVEETPLEDMSSDQASTVDYVAPGSGSSAKQKLLSPDQQHQYEPQPQQLRRSTTPPPITSAAVEGNGSDNPAASTGMQPVPTV